MPDYKCKKPFYMEPDKFNEYHYSETLVTTTDIVKQINKLKGQDEFHLLKNSDITKRLMQLGAIDITQNELYDFGERIGLYYELRPRKDKPSQKVLFFSPKAEKFIVGYLYYECLYKGTATDSWDVSNKGKEWTSEEDKKLVLLFISGMTVRAIAMKLKRTHRGVVDRLNALGYGVFWEAI